MASKAELIAYSDILAAIYDSLLVHAEQGDDLETVIEARAASRIHEFRTGIVNEAMWLGIVYPSIQAPL